MRIVSWNIRAGGGTRVGSIARQLEGWAPDIVALCEFRATPPSRELASSLASLGLAHQCTRPRTAGRQSPARRRALAAAAPSSAGGAR